MYDKEAVGSVDAVNEAIKAWLNGAKDRNGGRKERSRRN